MVRRDRNHPSIVMWSIGNEIPEQRNAQAGEAMATRLAAFVREEDPTRPVTAGMNNPTQALQTDFAKPLDLFGVNYNLGVYGPCSKRRTEIFWAGVTFRSRFPLTIGGFPR